MAQHRVDRLFNHSYKDDDYHKIAFYGFSNSAQCHLWDAVLTFLDKLIFSCLYLLSCNDTLYIALIVCLHVYCPTKLGDL